MRKLEEFTEFDANGDGELTLEEMRDGLKARQFSELEIKNMFNRLEKNENGNIGPKQYALMSIPV
jgi:Ca2+-binding EF-hand superfamily protein|eukprot:COSAG01_NODE_307_length_19161_cov_67.724321_7_plen_65_part_00